MKIELTIEQQREIHLRMAHYHLQKAIDPTAPIEIPHFDPFFLSINTDQSPVTNQNNGLF
jgi:hypothetical protein